MVRWLGGWVVWSLGFGFLGLGICFYGIGEMRLEKLFPFVFLILLATFLRWHDLGAIRLLWDHSYPIAQAQRLIAFGEFPIFGQKSTFFLANPPGQAYLTAIPLSIFNSTWAVFWFFTTLNLLAVPILYRFSRRVCGEHEAMIAALLYAVSPWIVHFSRMTWANALVPLGTVIVWGLLTWSISNAPLQKRTRYTIAMFISVIVLGQAYLFELIMMPMQIGAIMLARFKRIPWRGVIVGAAILILTTLIYSVAVIRDWDEQVGNFNRITRGSDPSLKLDITNRLALQYVTGADYYLANTFIEPLEPPLSYLQSGVEIFLLILIVVGAMRCVLSILRREERSWIDVSMLIWWLIPVLALSYNNQPLHPWHLTATLPVGHLFAARGAMWIVEKWRRAKTVLIAVGGVTAITFVSVILAAHQYNVARPAWLEFDLVTLDASRQIGKEMRALADKYNTNEVYANLHSVVTSAWAERPLEAVSWFSEEDLLIISQERPAIYVRLCHGVESSLLPLAQREKSVVFPNNDFVVFDVIPPMTREQMAALPQAKVDWRSETGMTLLGYTLSESFQRGKTSTITMYWFIDDLAETRGNYIFAPYVHLDSPDGSVRLNVSAPGLPGYHYRLGDLYIQPVRLAIPTDAPAGIYHFEMGLYDGLHTKGTTFFPPGETPRPFYSNPAILP